MSNQPENQLKELQGVVIVIIIIALSAAGYWFFTSTKFAKPELKVTAEKLYKDYSDGELKADLKYKDKVILVSGVVSTTFSQFDKPNVLLKTESSIFTVQCRFKKNSPAIAKLEKGDTVKIKGYCTGKTLANIFLEDCIMQ